MKDDIKVVYDFKIFNLINFNEFIFLYFEIFM